MIILLDLLYSCIERFMYNNDAMCLQNISKRDLLKLIAFSHNPMLFNLKNPNRYSFILEFILTPSIYEATKADHYKNEK
jgi:hypothetical protein